MSKYKLGKTRKLGGDLFGFHSKFGSKSAANQKARNIRKHGHLARVVPEAKGYSVYVQWQFRG